MSAETTASNTEIAERPVRRPAADRSLSAQGISVQLGGLNIIRSVSLEVQPGEVLAIIGPNGAGKTTLLNVVSGFLPPTEGSVWLGDHDVTGKPPHVLARYGIARSFQGVRLFPRLSVLENVELAGLRGGRSRRRIRARARELLGILGLGEVAEAEASDIPYGDARRVALARVAAADPAFMLLDEPTAGLDESESDAFGDTLKALRQESGCGVLMVEHDMRVVAGQADRVHVLDAGSTLAVGNVAEIRSNPDVITAYLGSVQDDTDR